MSFPIIINIAGSNNNSDSIIDCINSRITFMFLGLGSQKFASIPPGLIISFDLSSSLSSSTSLIFV